MNAANQFLLVFSFFILMGCEEKSNEGVNLPERTLSEEFKDYWFAGEAEITSYRLEQSRYGEPREGEAVLVFVTEDFLKSRQVKANNKSSNSTPVLKLNALKNFNTGIYPYSIMQSTFYPLEGNSHALKITASIQEWCGQVYMQLNKRSQYLIQSHSYFEEEADQSVSTPRVHLENEIWTQLRIDPNLLPTGEIRMIPSFEYIRLAHIEIRAYKATAEFYGEEDDFVYRITYPYLNRSIAIHYDRNFPHSIEKWVETTGRSGKENITTAIRMSSIKTDYWNKNSNKDLPLRKELNLN